MKNIPETEKALVLRTDFSDDAAWESICAAIEEPVGEFRACVDFVSAPAFQDLSLETLLSLIPASSNRTFMFVVDQVTFSTPEHSILVVELFWERRRSFRVIASEMWGVENNLSLALPL